MTKNDWILKETSILIEAYREEKVFWNYRAADYRNTNLRAVAYETLQNKLCQHVPSFSLSLPFGREIFRFFGNLIINFRTKS